MKSFQVRIVKKRVIVTVLVLLAFCIAGLGIYALIISQTDTRPSADVGSASKSILLDNNGNATNGVARTRTSKEMLEDLKKAQINVTDKLSSSIIFPSGKSGSTGRWMVENVKTNSVIIQCEVCLNNQLIAKSVPIRPGQYIDSISLLKDVKPGLYNAMAYVNYFRSDTQAYISKAAFNIKVTVQ